MHRAAVQGSRKAHSRQTGVERLMDGEEVLSGKGSHCVGSAICTPRCHQSQASGDARLRQTEMATGELATGAAPAAVQSMVELPHLLHVLF